MLRIKVVHGCYQLWTSVCTTFCCLLAGYRLAIDWLWPQINTLQDIVIYYCVPRLDIATVNTFYYDLTTIDHLTDQY